MKNILGIYRGLVIVFVVFGLSTTAFAGLLLDVLQSTLDLGSVTIGSNDNFSGSLGLMTVSDDRGGSPGWSLTGAASHMTTIRPAMRIVGNVGGMTSGGVYDGILGVTAPPSIYNVIINQSGAVGTATFDVSGAESMNSVVTGSFVAIGTKGVRVTFDIGNYSVGDRWMIAVDVFPYTDMTITPGDVTVNSGSGVGVSAGSAGVFSGTDARSTPKVFMSSSSGNGTGSYSITPNLFVDVHDGSVSGTYVGDILFTVS